MLEKLLENQTKKSFTLLKRVSENSCRTGFTLAEVLITIGIVGVVAAMTLPMLKANIEERVNTERQVNIVQKITQAMEVMKSHGELYNFNSTEEFVDGLQQYLKIAKRCDSEHIADCWPTKTVKNTSGSVYQVKDAKRRNDLGFADEQNVNNVGLILADGASLIITYNPSATNSSQYEVSKTINKSLPVGEGKTKDFAYTTDVTTGIAFVMDVNGKGAPNQETIDNKYYDIRSFNGAHFGTNGKVECRSGVVANGYCVEILDSYISVSCVSDEFREFCGTGTSSKSYVNDFWAGAQYACKQIDMELPSMGVLQKLYFANWENKPTSGKFWSLDVFAFYDTPYSFDFSDGSNNNYFRNNNSFQVLCVKSYK